MTAEMQEFYRMGADEDWCLQHAIVPPPTNNHQPQSDPQLFRNRLLLALKSSLPNEQDWALNKLALLSYYGTSDAFVAASGNPGGGLTLVSEVWRFVLSLPAVTQLRQQMTFKDLPATQVNQVMLILHTARNLSQLDRNVRLMLQPGAYVIDVSLKTAFGLLDLVKRVLEMPDSELNQEAVVYALDILENMSAYIKLNDGKLSQMVTEAARHNTN